MRSVQNRVSYLTNETYKNAVDYP